MQIHVTYVLDVYNSFVKLDPKKNNELICRLNNIKDTGTKFEPLFSFVMLNYFRTNQYEEP